MSKKAISRFFVVALLTILLISSLILTTTAIAQDHITVERVFEQEPVTQIDVVGAFTSTNLTPELSSAEVEPEIPLNSVDETAKSLAPDNALEPSVWEQLNLEPLDPVENPALEISVDGGSELLVWEDDALPQSRKPTDYVSPLLSVNLGSELSRWEKQNLQPHLTD